MADDKMEAVFAEMLEAMRPALRQAYTHANEVGTGWMRVTVNDETGMVEVENLHHSHVLTLAEEKEASTDG